MLLESFLTVQETITQKCHWINLKCWIMTLNKIPEILNCCDVIKWFLRITDNFKCRYIPFSTFSAWLLSLSRLTCPFCIHCDEIPASTFITARRWVYDRDTPARPHGHNRAGSARVLLSDHPIMRARSSYSWTSNLSTAVCPPCIDYVYLDGFSLTTKTTGYLSRDEHQTVLRTRTMRGDEGAARLLRL